MKRYVVEIGDHCYHVTARYKDQAVLRAVRRLPPVAEAEYLAIHVREVVDLLSGEWTTVYRRPGEVKIVPGTPREWECAGRRIWAPSAAEAARIMFQSSDAEVLEVKEISGQLHSFTIPRAMVL